MALGTGVEWEKGHNESKILMHWNLLKMILPQIMMTHFCKYNLYLKITLYENKISVNVNLLLYNTVITINNLGQIQTLFSINRVHAALQRYCVYEIRSM